MDCENDTVQELNSWVSVQELCSHKLIKGIQSLLSRLMTCDDWHLSSLAVAADVNNLCITGLWDECVKMFC